jgi:hypothetical protein
MYRIFDKVKKELNDDLQVDGNDDIYECVNVPMNSKLSCGLVSRVSSNYIVQQCTGKYSLDENVIYEGDIVGIQMKDPNKMYRAIVKYGDCQFYFEPINENEWIEDWNLIDDSCRLEIIGNIMEDNNG